MSVAEGQRGAIRDATHLLEGAASLSTTIYQKSSITVAGDRARKGN